MISRLKSSYLPNLALFGTPSVLAFSLVRLNDDSCVSLLALSMVTCSRDTELGYQYLSALIPASGV
ncbi:MAG: hypothetical protein AAFO04_30210, partial [Cyanobacteria bacterium J06592_8]